MIINVALELLSTLGGDAQIIAIKIREAGSAGISSEDIRKQLPHLEMKDYQIAINQLRECGLVEKVCVSRRNSRYDWLGDNQQHETTIRMALKYKRMQASVDANKQLIKSLQESVSRDEAELKDMRAELNSRVSHKARKVEC